MEMNIETLINFIKDLVKDEFDYALDYVEPEYYFQHGGCLEFAKILKHYINDSSIVISKDKNHFAVKYEDEVYDVTGKLSNPTEFTEVNQEYIQQYQEQYGRNIKIEDKTVDNAIIDELNNCSGDYVEQLVSNINKK